MRKIISLLFPGWIRIKSIFQFSPHNISTAEGKSNERYRRILLTGGSTAIVKLFSACINLITVPLTVNYLGAERYGMWMAISSILALMSFADLGLGNGLLNAVSKANGRNDIKGAQVAVSSTFYILLGIAISLFILFISIFPFISWANIFKVTSPLAIQEAGPTILILVSIFLVNMPLGIIQRIQDGYQEGYRFQLWLILGSLLSFCGLLICLYLECGLTWLVLAFSGGQLIATISNGVYLFTYRRQYLKPHIKFFNLEIGKNLIKSGLVFLVLGIFTLLANASDDIIIAQTLGASSVAGYEVVKKLFFFSMFTQFIIQPLWPAFGEAMESGDTSWAKKTLNKCLLLSISAGAVITLPLLLLGRPIISFWVGIEYIPSWTLLIGFYVYAVLNNYIGVMSTFLNSSHYVSKQLIPIGLTALISILLKIYLSQKFGVGGIIWATAIAWSLFFVLPSYYLSRSILHHKKIVDSIPYTSIVNNRV